MYITCLDRRTILLVVVLATCIHVLEAMGLCKFAAMYQGETEIYSTHTTPSDIPSEQTTTIQQSSPVGTSPSHTSTDLRETTSNTMSTYGRTTEQTTTIQQSSPVGTSPSHTSTHLRESTSNTMSTYGRTEQTTTIQQSSPVGTSPSHTSTPLRESTSNTMSTYGRTSDNPNLADWTEWNQHLYLMVYTVADWGSASSLCQEKLSNAHLVYIESNEENTFVHSMLTESDGDAWIGLSDADEEGTWRWGSAVADFFVWSEWSNEPDGGTRENCAVKLQSDPPWYDIECYHQFYYICERDFL